MNCSSIWNGLIFVLNLCLQVVMAFFPESCMKKGKRWSAICNYKQSYKSPCVSSMKLKRSTKDSLCYSESIYVHFRPSKSTLQELWTFACIMTSRKLSATTVNWKIVCCLHLVPPMPLHCGLKVRLAILSGLMYITSISVGSSKWY